VIAARFRSAGTGRYHRFVVIAADRGDP